MKLYTLEEANRLIPTMEKFLSEFQTKYRKLEQSKVPAGREVRSPLEEELLSIIRAITEMGCVLRDPIQGLIDFPSTRNQEPIYLCWVKGEPEIRFYHGVEDGFRGRKPI